jgi:hypothetical protein
MTTNNILLKCAGQIADHARAERLLRVLAQYTFDGTEIHHIVDHELRGLGHEIAQSNIRHAIVSQYRDTVPIDLVIKTLMAALNEKEPT